MPKRKPALSTWASFYDACGIDIREKFDAEASMLAYVIMSAFRSNDLKRQIMAQTVLRRIGHLYCHGTWPHV